MIGLVGLGLGFGYSFAREVVQAQSLANQATLSRQQNEVLAESNRKLERDLQYYQSDAYAELRARTDLNMRRPDEQIILPVLQATPAPGTDSAQTAAPAPAAAAASTAPDQSTTRNPQAAPADGRNWDHWFALFLGNH
jgi:cell division protein FtsB